MSTDPQFVVVDVALGDAMRRVEERIRAGEASRLPELAGWLGQMAALVQLRIAGVARESGPAPKEDRVLDVKAVAERLGQSTSWVYAHQHELPFLVRGLPGGSVKFSERGLESFLRRKSA